MAEAKTGTETASTSAGSDTSPKKLKKKDFERELERLQREFVLLQEYVKSHGLKVVVIFEGRDAAGKERRFQARTEDPMKRWKLSPMDLKSRENWVEYSKAKDTMMLHTDIKQAPWYVVDADDKRKARLNCMTHLLAQIPYQDLTPDPIELPPRQDDGAYVRPPKHEQTFVPEVW